MNVCLRKIISVYLKVSEFYGLINSPVTLNCSFSDLLYQFSFLYFSVRGTSQRKGRIIKKLQSKGIIISRCFPLEQLWTICFCWASAWIVMVWGKEFLLSLGSARLLI